MNEMKYLRILYVEDDEGAREALGRFLKPRVGKIITAETGEEGYEKYLTYKPNLLIVDLILPGMSGLDFISEIRKNDAKVKILIISTVNEVHTVLEAVDRRIEHYIIKPIDTDALEQKLQSIAAELIKANCSSQNLLIANPGLVEEMIRRLFVSMLKKYTGKGPSDLKVLLTDQFVELHIVDALTVMEKSLLTNKRNVSLAEQSRKQLYEEIGFEIEQMISNATGVDARIVSIKVDGIKKTDKLVLTFCRNL